MPKNVMKLIKPSPHRARNDFDLSHRNVYGANFGELLPVTQIETVPGDHIEINVANLLRAMPMATSPFLRAKQHLDVWYVPYRDLWHNFDSFITKKDQPVSSALKKSIYCPYMDLQTVETALNAATGSDVDIVGSSLKNGCWRIFDLLGYGRDATVDGVSISQKVNPFRILAYNYIWYNEYRNKYYDEGTFLIPTSLLNNYNPALLFNADSVPCNSLASAALDTNATVSETNKFYWALFQMRYRQWKKDLYTGLLPSTQFGAVSTVSANALGSVLRFRTTGDSSPTGDVQLSSGYIQVDAGNTGTYANATLYSNQSISETNILNLRKAEALQIWRENALRAGNRVSDNMMAHYGVQSDFRDHRPTFLGSVDAPLNISDIDSTAETGSSGNQILGSIGGKGLSSMSNKTFKFDAKDFGVIMVIHSLLPEAEYESYGCDRMNQLLEAEDFFTPEYENLGLESVASGNFYMQGGAQGAIGYAPRYYGYKQKLDKCFGQFRSLGLYAPWCSPRTDVPLILSAGVPTALPLRNLYVDPSLYNNNFAFFGSGYYQFLCDTYFEVDAVRPMSVMGMPAGV